MNSSQESLENSFNDINFSKETFKRLRRSKAQDSSKNVLTKCQTIGLSKNNGISNQTTRKSSKHDAKDSQSNDKLNTSSIISTQQLQKLESWGLPPGVLAKYEERGITEMFHWQVECLSNIKILNEHANLVYSAPTSAGKTLVAEILAIKTVLERQRKVLIILPFVSVVREKMFYFKDIFRSNGVRVEGFMGSYNPPGGFAKVQVAICTIEKANNIVNRLLEDNNIEDIGAVVIDELHLLGDPSRGYLLELLLTKLLYISQKKPELKIQIIGMSATLPNLSVLSTWLKAELYKTEFRPIPLLEQCYIDGKLCDSNFQVIRKIEPHTDIPKDMDNIIQFCLETIYCSCSVLIFCSAKNWCETLAQQISQTFRQLGRSESPLGACLREQLKTESIMEVLEQLKRCPVGLDTILKITVSFGVAFHHAGLTIDERDIIEAAFRNGAIRVLIATSTLSAGVNLPARRVIIRSPMFAGKPMDTLTYRQMIGRAGRMGKDTAGESILICQKNETYAAKQLLSGNLRLISSCLEGSGRLKRAILEVIASGVAVSPADIRLFTACTLLASIDSMDEMENPIDETVHFLLRNEFIRLQKSETNQKQYVATALAKACLSSAMPPEEGLTLFAELEKARQCFVLESELHIIYLVTPYSACNQWGTIDWMLYQSMWDNLSEADKRVGELIGISESYIVRAMSGRLNNSKSQHRLHIHRRFYVALALRELVEEIPLPQVAEKYQCNRGLLQSLQQSASTFAGMVTAFSKQLGWSGVELLVSQFQDRLQFGVNRELLDLMRMPSLNGICARLLFNAGIETIVMLASCDVCTLENILTRAVPFEREQQQEQHDGETAAFEADKRKRLKTVWISGKNGLREREAAEMLIVEARDFLKYEMGIVEAKWDCEVSTNSIESDNETEPESELDTSSSKLYVTLNSITQTSKISTPLQGIENSEVSQTERLNCNVIENLDSPTPKEKAEENMDEHRLLPPTECAPKNETETNEMIETNIRESTIENRNECLLVEIPETKNDKQPENYEINSKMFESDSIFNNISKTENLVSKLISSPNHPNPNITQPNQARTFSENNEFNTNMFESESIFNNISRTENLKPKSTPSTNNHNPNITQPNQTRIFSENNEFNTKMFESESIFNNISRTENSKPKLTPSTNNHNPNITQPNQNRTSSENNEFNTNMFESESIFNNISKTENSKPKSTPTINNYINPYLTQPNQTRTSENNEFNTNMFESESIFNNISRTENSKPKSTPSINIHINPNLTQPNQTRTFSENNEFNTNMFESESIFNNISRTENSKPKLTPSTNNHNPNITQPNQTRTFSENDGFNTNMFESESIFNNISRTENSKPKSTPTINNYINPNLTQPNQTRTFSENNEFNTNMFESESIFNNICTTTEPTPPKNQTNVMESKLTSPTTNKPTPSTSDISIDIKSDEIAASVLNRVQIGAEEFAKASDYYVLENNFLSNMELNISMKLKYDWSTINNGEFSDLEKQQQAAAAINKSVNENLLNDIINRSGSLFDESMLIDSNICNMLDNQIVENQSKTSVLAEASSLLSNNNSTNNIEKHLKDSFLDHAFDSFTLPINNNDTTHKSIDDDIVLNSNDESMDSPCFERTGKSLSKLHENTKRKLLLINKSTKSDITTNSSKRTLKTISSIQFKKHKIQNMNSSIQHKKDKIDTIILSNQHKKDPIETTIGQHKKDTIETIQHKKDQIETTQHKKDTIDTIQHKKDPIETIQHKRDKIETIQHKKDKVETIQHKKDQIETIQHKKDKVETIQHKKDQIETIQHKKDKVEAIQHKKEQIETIQHKKDKVETIQYKKDQIETIQQKKDHIETIQHKQDIIQIKNSPIEHKKDPIKTLISSNQHKKDKIETINLPIKQKRDKIETISPHQNKIIRLTSPNKKDKIETKFSTNKHKKDKIETINSLNQHKKDKTETINSSMQHKKDKIETIVSPNQHKKDRIETIRSRKSLRTRKIDQIEIIDVCKNRKLYETITKKILLKSVLSISVACEKFIKNKSEIGNRMIRYRSGLTASEQSNSRNRFVINDRQIIGFSIYGNHNIVYFFSLEPAALVADNEVLAFFQQLFSRDNLTIYQFDAKEQIKLLLQLMKFSINCKYLDPKIIQWLFNPENRERSLHNLVRDYAPELNDLAKSAGKSKYQDSISLNVDSSSVSGKLRSATEALCSWHIVEAQQMKINEQNWDMTKILDVEMGTVICLANMEVIGFGVNVEQLDHILSLVQEKMAEIETECYSLVGRHFSLSSSTEVAKVLKLAKTRKVSTNKQVLEKLDNPIAVLVILWRKLNAILTKTLFPVLRDINGSRIYCCSDSFNATGRISMYEPSLQSIPRNFDITINNDSTMQLSVRSAFVPKTGYVLISADYCQLELRLLAHFSKDKRLCTIMYSDEDVFQLIAAKWNRIPIDEVDDIVRNRAKQLCYGIIYGMGVKTLSDQLDIDENQASEMIESFKDTYPNIRDFIDSTIERCRTLGYVETLYGRRRYLENINKSNSLKSQAARQAVNTTIQGSAADIAKTAMVEIQKTIQAQYTGRENVASLVLHMHDELIYEAKITELNAVMLIIKNCMESAVELSVPFPVKIKYGYSWGDMEVVDKWLQNTEADNTHNISLDTFVCQKGNF